MNTQHVTSTFKESAHRLLDAYGAIVRRHGFKIDVHNDKAWEKFLTHPPEIQKILVERFATQLSVVEDIANSETDLRNPVQTVWRILQKFDWKPSHDLFERIDKKDVVEIYLPDNTQLYRSMNYFRYTSYSLSELLFYPWHELIEHQLGFQDKIAEYCQAIFAEQKQDEYYEFSTPYVGLELFSKDKLNAQLRCKAFSPLKGRHSGMNEAVIVIWNIDLVQTNGRSTYEKEIEY
jgi:hypothetical protein